MKSNLTTSLSSLSPTCDIESQFQELYAQSLVNSDIRNELQEICNGFVRVNKYGAEVIERFQAMDWQRFEAFARFILLTRYSKAVDGLPLTAWMMGNSLLEYVDCYSNAGPSESPKIFREALAIGEFVAKKLADNSSAPRFVAEVLNFELSSIRVRFAKRLDFWEKQCSSVETIGHENCGVRLGRYTMIVETGVEIEILRKQMETQEYCECDIKEGQYFYVLWQDNEGKCEEQQVSLSSFLTLKFIESGRGTREIIQRLIEFFKISEIDVAPFVKRFEENIDKLLQLDVIYKR